MAQAMAPMACTEVTNLANLGISQSSFTFTNATMESEDAIVVREESGASPTLCVVDPKNPASPLRRPISAESCIMSPLKGQKVLALRASANGVHQLQVFNLDTKARIGQHQMTEAVVFWKWISDAKIGIVTATAVFHWDPQAGEPVKVFDRTQNLAGSQIISYRVTPDEKWSALVGILPGSGDRPQLVRGAMQLHSVEQGRSQPLEAQAASFSTLKVGAESKNVIVFAQKTVAEGQINSKLHIIELGAPSAGRQPLKKQAELFFPQEFADDFPVSLQVSEKYMLVYVITKFGLLFVYDLETATAIYRNRISQDPIFLACGAESTGGFYAIARTGRLLHGNVNPQGMVPFISNQLQNLELALAMAKRGGLPGADQLVQQQYRKLVQEQKFAEAAVAAAESPQGLLRTQQVVAELKQMPAQPGGKPPILVYFGTLLQKGTLNSHESVEMATMVFPQGKFDMLKTWWREGKLTASEQLADSIVNHPQASQDSELVGIATEMYKSSGAHQKVVMAYAAQGDIEQMMAAAGRAGQAPDYMFLLQSLMGSNPEGAVALAKRIAKETPPPIDINSVTDLFLQRRMIKECTSFLVEALEGDKPEHAHLQTKLLEINLITQPQIADAIMANTSMTHYDRPRIAQLCEKAGLYMRALQHYTDLPDIKRCIINTSAIDPKALTEYFGSLSADWALECLREILSNNLQMNTQLVVDVAKEYTEQLGVQAIMEMFEAFNSWQGLFLYLGSRIHTAEDPEEHYKYIESAARIGQIREVERHTRESSSYPPEKVKNLLMDMKLPDARPLINVCDRFDMVGDLTTYLYHNNLLRYIEGYVQKVNSNSTPKVVGALLDVEAPEDFIQNLILSVRALVPVEPLVEEIEARNLLKMLLPFLEHLISEGSTDSAVHNALGKIIVDTNQNPEHFLKNNEHYEPLVVGKYCEKRDPHLAVVAYRRGLCDDALVDCTNRHSLFKLQSRYVVERQDAGLWAKVLDEENPFRRQLIDQVVSTALPECTEPERVSTSVKAFMEAGLQAELIELLEKIVLQNSAFSSNRNLQNLLIITAIKSDQTRVKDYVRRLDQFDGIAVGEIAVEKGLYDEAFEIYKKFHENVLAIRVLLENLGDLDRAYEFASKVDDAVVWSELGNAQLAALQVPQAIESFLRAADSTKYQEVITGANQAGCFRELVNYLLMARKKVKDPIVDSELVYAYAQTGDQNDLEAFLAGPHQANLQQCGDRCFREGLYESARVLFSAIPNWGRLASTLVRLRHFNDAVDAARKANNPKVWKEVCFACVEEREFRLAQLCALNIIINADDLDEVSEFYQRRGHFEELMALMESGIGLERAHMGIFTELGMLFARYRPESLMEHLKLFSNKINVPRLIRICEDQQLWKELTFLYVQYDEFDNAASVMIMHPVAWDHVYFKDVCVKVSNVEVYYRALTFYLDQHPGLLTDLLKVLEARVDHARVVDIMHKADQLALVKEYLLTVQKHNMVPVNEAVNELLIEEEDFQGLRTSIETYENFDMQAYHPPPYTKPLHHMWRQALASELESHELIEFRRIAAYLYKKNLKWQKAVELAKRDSLYKDAMETAAQSEDGELVEELLRYFVSEGQQECFAAALYTCYDHIKPDVVLELAWMHGLMDLIMPFMIQFLKEYVSKVDLLMSERKETAEKKAEEEETVKQQEMVRNAMINMPLALEYNVAGGGAGMPDPNMTGGGYPGGPPPAGGFTAAPPGYDAAYTQQGVPAYPPQGYGM